MSLGEFFGTGDGLTSLGVTSTGLELIGYFDVNEIETYLDDDIAENRAQFLCESFDRWQDEIGSKFEINGTTYRINNITPDGTGLVTLSLLAE